jgi:ubiquitin-protein ligase
MSKVTLKRIQNEIKMYSKDNFSYPNLIIKPNQDNLFIWYFVVHSLFDTPYENGIYLGTVIINDGYPFKAPDFKFFTPNGRFEINKKICTSFSAFHNESYSSAWNILTMTSGLISFMTEEVSEINNGIGSIYTTTDERKRLANESIQWNHNNDVYNKYFKNDLF